MAVGAFGQKPSSGPPPSVLVALLIACVPIFGYISCVFSGYQFWHTPGCVGANVVGAVLPVIDTPAFFLWCVVFWITAYFFITAGRQALWDSTSGAFLWGGRLVCLGAIAFSAQFDSRPTRMCVSDEGFSYRQARQPDEVYQWSDIQGITPVCHSHGGRFITLEMNKGPGIKLPASFVFSNENEKLWHALNGLNVNFNGMIPPLSESEICR